MRKGEVLELRPSRVYFFQFQRKENGRPRHRPGQARPHPRPGLLAVGVTQRQYRGLLSPKGGPGTGWLRGSMHRGGDACGLRAPEM